MDTARLRGELRDLFGEAWPPLQVRHARRIVEARRASLTDEIIREDERYGSWYTISVSKLDELIKAEHERADKLEDKAARITAVLALALTIGGTLGISLVGEVSISWLQLALKISLYMSMFYLLIAGWSALFSGSAARPRGGYGPDWEAQLAYRRVEDKQLRVQALVEFEFNNLLLNNDIYGALVCVRNGAFIFFVVLVIASVDALAPAMHDLWNEMLRFVLLRKIVIICYALTRIPDRPDRPKY